MSGATGGAPIRWGSDGLATVVTVDAASGDVLMVASMNAEALALTRETGVVHYWSRSRDALWRKGATSGHEQRLVEIRVNCNRDSLLVRVKQQGAVCHNGYATCYYRRLDADDSLTVVEQREFDPEAVYGATTSPAPSLDLVQEWYGAYAALRDEDLESVSGTSRRLRAEHDEVTARLADELNELAGVLDGSHRHRSFADDIALEATQCLYWAALVALRSGIDGEAFGNWVLNQTSGDMSRTFDSEKRASLLRNLGAAVRSNAAAAVEWLPEVVAAVSAAAARGGHDVPSLIAADLDDLGSRPYLCGYFGRLRAG